MQEPPKINTKPALHERDERRTDLSHAGRDWRKDGGERRDRWRPDRIFFYLQQFSTFSF